MDERPGRVSCPHCGKSYRWKPAFAGRKARCKRCDGVIRMPVEAPDGDIVAATEDANGDNEFELLEPGQTAATAPLAPGTLPGTPGTGRCPSCGNVVKSSAVICISCGYNIREGTQLQTTVDTVEDDAPDGKKGKKKKKKSRKQADGEQEAQPKTRLTQQRDSGGRSKESAKSRHGCLTAYLVLIIFANAVVMVLAPWLASVLESVGQDMPDSPIWILWFIALRALL